MKKSIFRFFSAITAAAVAVVSLAAMVSAKETEKKQECLYDITPSRQGEIVYVDNDTYYRLSSGEYAKGLVYACPYSGGNNQDTSRRMMIFDKKTGLYKGNYTGFTKNSEGKRYYDRGYREYGWSKINGSWYYFDPLTGVAATGDTKIGSGVYSFSKTGRWTGKVSDEGKYPADFIICIRNGQYDLTVDIAENSVELMYNYSCDTRSDSMDNYSQEVKITSRDVQVLYSIVTAFGYEGDLKINEAYIREAMKTHGGTDSYEEWEYSSNGPETRYAYYQADGGKIKVLNMDEHTGYITAYDLKALHLSRTMDSLMAILRSVADKNPAPDYVEFCYPE